MGEIKTPIIRLTEGVPYIPASGDCIISDRHTLADILRYYVEVTSIEDVAYLVREMQGVARDDSMRSAASAVLRAKGSSKREKVKRGSALGSR